MVVVLLLAALVGSVLTVAILWPYGALVAMAGAPFGGSLCAAALAGIVAALRGTVPLEGGAEHGLTEQVQELKRLVELGVAPGENTPCRRSDADAA